MRWIKRLLILSIFLQLPAYAALDLELTQGIQGAMPLAVIPFAGQSSPTDPMNIATVVSSDLGNSGRFKVADPISWSQDPHSNQDVNYGYWKSQGQNDLVIGNVQDIGGNKYRVSFQLIDVYAGANSAPTPNQSSNSILLEQQFTIPKSELRALAHHISDMVYQKLTGDRGIFSTKIAYVLMEGQKYYLDVSDIDGYNPKALVMSPEPIMSPAWSPNGKQIAYVTFEKGNACIYIQDLATGRRFKVSDFPGINGAPAWSPDGSKLALVLTSSGYPKIYVMDVASRQLTQETDGTANDTEPSWSPDGQSLLFTSDRGGGPQIYEINLASKQIQRLTFTGNYNARASFTPDGKSIVVLTQTDSGYNIAMQDLQSGRIELLTNSGMAQSPSIAPNGKMVVFANVYQGNGVLGMASTDGSVKLRIPSQDGSVQEPAWSPFMG